MEEREKRLASGEVNSQHQLSKPQTLLSLPLLQRHHEPPSTDHYGCLLLLVVVVSYPFVYQYLSIPFYNRRIRKTQNYGSIYLCSASTAAKSLISPMGVYNG